MGWFEDQIRVRKEADQDIFEDALRIMDSSTTSCSPRFRRRTCSSTQPMFPPP